MTMTPYLRRSVAALGVAGAVLAVIGRGSRSAPEGTTTRTLSVPNPAQAAADAAKEGGFMGFKAQLVSDGEQSMLDRIREAVGD